STQESLIAAFDKAMKAESVLAEELIRTLCKLRELLTDSQKANFAKFVQVQINPWVKEASDYLPKPPAMPNPLPTPPAAEEGK
ncbi:MAG: hypothetical protein N3B12_08150, partial [Armatimonadetes bacterium]|nr:hypothetical protein [Armatimonadota bacterium]